MPNWGVPDYDTSEVIDYDALHARIRKEDPNAIVAWDMEARPTLPGYPPKDIQAYCVRSRAWQEVRISMKGKPTHCKLSILEAWWEKHILCCAYETEVQVGNYLGALRRGGQLDSQNRIRKYI